MTSQPKQRLRYRSDKIRNRAKIGRNFSRIERIFRGEALQSWSFSGFKPYPPIPVIAPSLPRELVRRRPPVECRSRALVADGRCRAGAADRRLLCPARACTCLVDRRRRRRRQEGFFGPANE